MKENLDIKMKKQVKFNFWESSNVYFLASFIFLFGFASLFMKGVNHLFVFTWFIIIIVGYYIVSELNQIYLKLNQTGGNTNGKYKRRSKSI